MRPPEAVNPRIVARYLGGVDRSDIAALETFVEQALESRDANACVAAFVLAREIPGSESTRWGRTILNGASVMPDAALETLRGLEAEARSAEAEAARNQADYAIAMAASQVRLDGVEPPTEAELVRQARVEAKPHSRLGEPIGLALERRGFDVSQLDEILAGGDRDDTTA